MNPYTYRPLSVAGLELYSRVGMDHFTDLRAMAFRGPHDYVVLLLVMVTPLVLGYRRRVDLFELSALALGMAVSFRFQRESWVVVLLCVAAIANGARQDEGAGNKKAPEKSDLFRSWIIPLAATFVILVIFALRIPSGTNDALRKSGASLPVAACDYIQKAYLPQPLFNSYAWGGFLTWYLPDYPVAIDGRLGLYGEQLTAQHFAVVEGKVRLEQDEAFASARTILLEKDSALAKALSTLPQLSSQFRVVYSDDVATVFIRE
jgi:hypothetical protein